MLLSHASGDFATPTPTPITAPPQLSAEVANCLEHPEKIAHYPAELARLSFDEPHLVLSGRAANWVAEGLQHMATLTRHQLVSADRPPLYHRVFAHHHLRRARIAQSFHRLLQIAQALSEIQSSVSGDLGAAQRALAEAQTRVALLREAIDVGLAYLQQHQEAGLSADPMDTDPRDRFSRRISQLELLHANQLLATQQLRLTTDRILDSYERVKEFLDIAYAAWLQQIQPALNQIGETHE